nr:tetratricopeptide repeat protein [uncultured Sphaerochaeta sp.]
MDNKRFSLVRITWFMLVVLSLLFTGCVASLDAFTSRAIEYQTSKIVEEKAMEHYMGSNYELQPVAYTVPEIILPPSFSPLHVPITPPSNKETDALQQAILEVEQDRKQANTEELTPSLLLAKAYDLPSILQLASLCYHKALQSMGPYDRAELNRLLPSEPDFSGRSGLPLSSELVAMAILYGDSQPFKEALACAAFSYDSGNAVAASNLATALSTTQEEVVPIYRYALSLTLEEGAYTYGSVLPLINLGTALLEKDADEEAKQCFLAALEIDPSSWDAAVGLSSYYWKQGFRLKAKAVLEDAMLDRPLMFAMMKQEAEMLEEVSDVVEVPIDAPDEQYEKAIETIAEQPIMTAAEFISSMDQNERNKIRTFIDYLVPEGSYTPPKIDTILAYGSLQAIRQPNGIAALTDLTESVAMFATKASASYAKDLISDLERMGMNIDLQGINLDELEAHPEKYANAMGGNVQVNGVDQVYAYAGEMEQQAMKAELDLMNNRTDSSLQLATRGDPAMVIFQLNPADYVDPTNVLIQRYNMLQYLIKYNAYGSYLNSLTRKLITNLQGMAQQAGYSLYGLEEQFSGDKCKKAVQTWNDICSAYWNQMTSYASHQYLKKITPYAKAFYEDVFKHVAMISDPEVRQLKDQELRSAIDQAVLAGLEGVLFAYGAFDYYPIQEMCGDDYSRQEAIEQTEQKRQAKNNYEKKRFESGEIPPSSPLFKKLDLYGTDLDIPFVPISGRISVARTDLKLGFNLPTQGSPGFDYQYTKNNFTGKSMHDGSLSYQFGAGKGGAKIEGKLSVTGKIGFNGDGTVSDYGFGAKGEATASYQGTQITATGSVAVDSGGVSFTGDASGSFTTSIPQADAIEIEVTVQRDGSFTINPSLDFDPMGDLITEAAEGVVGSEGAPFIPASSDGLKKVFSGKFER